MNCLNNTLKSKIVVERDKDFVQLNMNINFNNNIEDYLLKFNELKSKGVIVNDNFSDNKWIIYEFNGNTYPKFKYEANDKLNNALKCFIIFEIYDKKKDLSTVGNELSLIIKAIDFTFQFDIDYLEDFIDYLSFEEPQTNRMCVAVIKFLGFYNIESSKEYIKIMNKIPKIKSSIRKLSHYTSIIEFDYILNKFMRYADEKQRHKYFPIFIWWRLTKVIPMRISEFCQLKRDCLIDENGKYYIEVNRIKHTSDKLKNQVTVKPLKEIQIDKDMYDILNEYKAFAIYEHDDRFFLSYKTYNQFLAPVLKMDNQIYEGRKIEKDYLGSRQLSDLLDSFYKMIVVKKENYKVVEKGFIKDNREIVNSDIIERINLNDTRHLAFCSMMLQGFSPLSIAQIGGHTKLETQNLYYGHLDTLCQGQVYILSKRMVENIDKRQQATYDFFNPRESLIKQKMLIENCTKNGATPRAIQDGLCWNEEAPNKNCYYENCLFCDFYSFELNDDTKIEYLKSNEEKIKNELNNQVEFLKKILENYKLEPANDKADLKVASKKIKSLIVKGAIVKSYQINSRFTEHN